MSDAGKAALLLLASNSFMTVAWYGHLRFKGAPLYAAIGVSWGDCPIATEAHRVR